jgi:hypothetical protein
MYRGKKGLPSVAQRNNSAFTINNFAFFHSLARSFVPMRMSASYSGAVSRILRLGSEILPLRTSP